MIVGRESPAYNQVNARLHEGVVALLAACLLFLVPVSWRPVRGVLTWRQAAEIDWAPSCSSEEAEPWRPAVADRPGGTAGPGIPAHRGEHGPLGDHGLGLPFLGADHRDHLQHRRRQHGRPALDRRGSSGGSVARAPGSRGHHRSQPRVRPASVHAPNAIAYGSGRIPILKMVRAGTGLDVVCYVALLLLLWFLSPRLGLL